MHVVGYVCVCVHGGQKETFRCAVAIVRGGCGPPDGNTGAGPVESTSRDKLHMRTWDPTLRVKGSASEH